MALRTKGVTKCLDRRLLIAGFEVLDLLAIFLTLSILHVCFADMGSQLLFIWLPSILLASVLWFGKRGKPENFLLHWIRFQMKPGTLSAFPEPAMCTRFRIKKHAVEQGNTIGK